MLEGYLDLRCGRRGGPAEELIGPALAFRKLRHAVIREDLVGKLAVLFRDGGEQLLFELLGVDLAHALVLAGNDDVDPVGLVTDVLVDPLELDFELVRWETHGAQHAEAAGTADRRHDVAAVTEGKDGELDPQLVTQFGTHVCFLPV